MKNVDYIIVGMGIAGLVFSKTLRDHGKSFVVIDSPKQGATKASGGVLNPTVLKRYTPAWNTVEFVLKAAPFYEYLARDIGQQVLSGVTIHRLLSEILEPKRKSQAKAKAKAKANANQATCCANSGGGSCPPPEL